MSGALAAGMALGVAVNEPVVSIRGNVETSENGFLSGWIQNELEPGNRLTVNIFEKNQLLTTAIADIHREDLEQQNIGDGRCGFRVTLDESLSDGRSHNLTVVEADSGYILGKINYKSPAFAHAEIDGIEGRIIRGCIRLREPSDHSGFEIELRVDGKHCTGGVCAVDANSGSYRYAIQLPPDLFDDCYHLYAVAITGLVTSSELHEDKLASILTPWKYLTGSAASPSLSTLPRVAGYRYCSLQSHMDLCVTGASASDMALVKLAHDAVVEGYEGRKKFPKLQLQAVNKPKVSIVIPVHNKFSLTYHCIASLILGYNKSTFEVIVVDDCSSDETSDIEDSVENVRLVKNDVNLGFLLSAKKGAEEARGEYIVFLNNDTEVTQGWIDQLCDVFDLYADVGAVGSKLIYPTGKLQEAGGIVWGNGKPWNVGNNANAETPVFNYTRQVDYLSGAALMIKKSVWDEIGGFSEELVPAYYEDTDVAFKVRAAGYRTYYCPSSVVIHFEGMSNGRELNSGIKRFQSVNAPKFRAKWRQDYRHNGKEGVGLTRQMDRNVDFRVLMIDYAVPKPDQDAGSYAAIQEMQLLQELGCKITFIPNNMAHMGAYTEALQVRGVECVYAPFYNNVGEFLKDRGQDFDLVYITRFDIAEEVIEYVRQYSNAKIVFNNADLHFLRELRAALATEEKDLKQPIATRDRELAVMRNVDAVLSYNEIEHSVITSHNLTSDNVFKCPWVLSSKRSAVGFSERNGIAFLGGFNHLPNREAVKYFVSDVMPLLRISMPGVKFHVYGSSVPAEIEALACDDVVIEGFVQSLSSVFDTCRVFIAPLLSGAGIKGKVLESISYGVPCVLSPVAAEATGLSHGVSAYIASEASEWVKCIGSLYNDEATWNKMSSASQGLVESMYSFSNGLEKMGDVLRYLELDPALSRRPLFKRAD